MSHRVPSRRIKRSWNPAPRIPKQSAGSTEVDQTQVLLIMVPQHFPGYGSGVLSGMTGDGVHASTTAQMPSRNTILPLAAGP